MSRILVAFYSRTGHTRRIANDLAGRLMADDDDGDEKSDPDHLP